MGSGFSTELSVRILLPAARTLARASSAEDAPGLAHTARGRALYFKTQETAVRLVSLPSRSLLSPRQKAAAGCSLQRRLRRRSAARPPEARRAAPLLGGLQMLTAFAYTRCTPAAGSTKRGAPKAQAASGGTRRGPCARGCKRPPGRERGRRRQLGRRPRRGGIPRRLGRLPQDLAARCPALCTPLLRPSFPILPPPALASKSRLSPASCSSCCLCRRLVSSLGALPGVPQGASARCGLGRRRRSAGPPPRLSPPPAAAAAGAGSVRTPTPPPAGPRGPHWRENEEKEEQMGIKAEGEHVFFCSHELQNEPHLYAKPPLPLLCVTLDSAHLLHSKAASQHYQTQLYSLEDRESYPKPQTSKCGAPHKKLIMNLRQSLQG
ncbi:uncharacterized protein LOC126948999 [Macaca thibetana thibetana]|uniref:uncharacterized protein LOC126948999 n=1 Tax=Macaca thibetana thibetana TaxID=257877 RepID=UPI0021BC777F|nr:uncharacterized protein LOC126948999 [Macaca thibetana thibetana]